MPNQRLSGDLINNGRAVGTLFQRWGGSGGKTFEWPGFPFLVFPSLQAFPYGTSLRKVRTASFSSIEC